MLRSLLLLGGIYNLDWLWMLHARLIVILEHSTPSNLAIANPGSPSLGPGPVEAMSPSIHRVIRTLKPQVDKTPR